MKATFWISLVLLLLGLIGLLCNVVTGFSLTKATGSDSDFHLTIALSSIASLTIGSIGLIQVSKKLILSLQEDVLGEKGGIVKKIESFTAVRGRSVSSSILVIVCSVINLISGTISQSGRFPLIHGLFGFVLVALAIGSLVLWTQVGIKVLNFKK